MLVGFNSAYNAPCQRVLDSRSPQAVVRERLERNASLTNPDHRPSPDPCILPKAMLVMGAPMTSRNQTARRRRESVARRFARSFRRTPGPSRESFLT